jgi:hypothetical protein
MAQLIIQLDDAILIQLKRRAWEQGLPFEESLRRLLAAVSEDETQHTSQPAPSMPKRRDGEGKARASRSMMMCS